MHHCSTQRRRSRHLRKQTAQTKTRLPRRKRIEIGLTYIYGIGRSTSNKILQQLNINPNTLTDDLTDVEINDIRKVIDGQFKVEGELRTDISMNIKRLMDLGCYRGLRHRKGLPVRGQRTSTNARTRKGPKRTAVKKKGAIKK